MTLSRLGERGWSWAPPLVASAPEARALELAAWVEALRTANAGASEIVAGTHTALVVGESAPPRCPAAPAPVARAPREHEIAVVYDGPELAPIAERAGLSAEAVARLHADGRYTATLIGFLPGFAYLDGLDPRLATPRLATPRARVPAGAVGVAGARTAVYPCASPGGWNLLGRASPRAFFDPRAERPARVALGDRVRFVAVEALAAEGAEPPPATPAAPGSGLRVEAAAGLVTIQDRGRFGLRASGVPWSGPLDRARHDAANAAVGNAPGDATVEVAGGRLVIAAEGVATVVSVDGAPAFTLARGDRVVVQPRARLAAYVAVAGGVAVEPVMGSRATLLVAGLGGLSGRALRRGDLLPVGTPRGAPAAAGRDEDDDDEPLLDVIPCAPDDRLGEDALSVLAASRFTVGAALDRVGARLEGGRVPRAALDVGASEPVLPGAIQITTDGAPVVLGPDAATTGGYPVIAVLDDAARGRFARLRPGRTLRFRIAP